jgi:hypothetical protein
MTRLLELLGRRDKRRVRQEFPCTLLVHGSRHRGLVQDVSAGGLFVETPIELPLGADAIVSFRTPEGRRFVLEASVPRRRQTALSVRSNSSGGVGLRIQDPTEAYLRWVEGLIAED